MKEAKKALRLFFERIDRMNSNNNVSFGTPIPDNSVEFGTVKYSNWEKGFGFIQPDKTGPDFYFRFNSGYEIRAGVSLPEFCSTSPKRNPRNGDRIVFVSTINGWNKPEASHWGYLKFYDKAILEIASRPIYRMVTVGTRFCGQYTLRPNRPEVARGTAFELQKLHPRGIAGDPLVPVYKTGRVVDDREWEKWDGKEWVKCQDPRPLLQPEEKPDAASNHDDGLVSVGIKLDKELEKFAISVCGRNRGVSHPKPKPADAYADPNIRAAVARC